ncbi:MAG: hypothetical protein AAF456_13325 [Planctomycetota bacterium]
MNPFRLHPALSQLMKRRFVARLRRLVESFRSPRRIVLSIIALSMAVVWIGQAVAGIFLRETADPQSLHTWLAQGLCLYTLWNILKVTFRTPVEPFEWTETERELLIGAPLTTGDLVRYRFATMTGAALFKASIFTVVMIPDLSILPLGFFGMFCGLMIIDLIRCGLEVLVGMLKPRELARMRLITFGFAAVIGGSAIASAIATNGGFGTTPLASWEFAKALAGGLAIQTQTWYGSLLFVPAGCVADVVTADSFSSGVILRMAGVAVTITAAFYGLLRLTENAGSRRKLIAREKFSIAQANDTPERKREMADRRIKRPATLGGVWPLGWRQLLGARYYRFSLAVALTIPLVLCCLPTLWDTTELGTVMNVVGVMAFYSFAWLPSALRFDFRRDVDRMAYLKALPITPTKAVLGQIAAPVLLLTAFQLGTLLLVMLIKPFSPALLLIGILILTPFNIFNFASENLMFLWYPHRMNQEGIHIFLRTILVFTAKGILFSIALVFVIAWLYFSNSAGKWLMPADPATAMGLTFCAGGMITMTVISWATIRVLSRTFEKFDPSIDLVGLD